MLIAITQKQPGQSSLGCVFTSSHPIPLARRTGPVSVRAVLILSWSAWLWCDRKNLIRLSNARHLLDHTSWSHNISAVSSHIRFTAISSEGLWLHGVQLSAAARIDEVDSSRCVSRGCTYYLIGLLVPAHWLSNVLCLRTYRLWRNLTIFLLFSQSLNVFFTKHAWLVWPCLLNFMNRILLIQYMRRFVPRMSCTSGRNHR